MGSTNCRKDPRIVLKEAIQGGITMFQFREKGEGSLVGEEKVRLAKELKAICHEQQIPFIVNDDVELALLIDADGLHIGQADGDLKKARQKMKSKILGISTHNVEEAEVAAAIGADYIGVGPMYETKTKKDIQEVKGPSVIEEIRESGVHLPLVAIGGITKGRIAEIAQKGADGIAVISAISQADCIKEETKALIHEFQMYQKRR